MNDTAEKVIRKTLVLAESQHQNYKYSSKSELKRLCAQDPADMAEKILELEQMLISCRGSIKTDLAQYERLLLAKEKLGEQDTPTYVVASEEANRLFDLMGKLTPSRHCRRRAIHPKPTWIKFTPPIARNEMIYSRLFLSLDRV